MKKVLLIVFVLLSMGLKAQEVEVEKKVDEFTNKVTYSPSTLSYYTDMEDAKRIFGLLPTIDRGKLSYLGASINGVGCIDDAKIYIMFEDGEVMTKTMFNKFNCDNLAGFRISDKDWGKLTTTKITKVKVTNKGKEIISAPDDDSYFIKLGESIRNTNFIY